MTVKINGEKIWKIKNNKNKQNKNETKLSSKTKQQQNC